MPLRMARVSVCAIALVASACQPRTRTKIVTVKVPEAQPTPGPELVDFKKQTYGKPLPVPMSDPTCLSKAEAKPLASEAVESVWFGYQDTDEETIAITTRVLDAETFERELTNKTDQRFTVQGQKKELAVCGTPVTRNSVETVGLQLKKAADDSFAFYARVRDAATALRLPALPNIGIGLFPQYKKDVKRIEVMIKEDGTKTQSATQTVTIQTDNAFYSPFADDTLSANLYAISIIPQSSEARDQGFFNGKGLWEFPVVFHHEYGHHVFQILFGDSTVVGFQNYLDYWQKHRSLHAIHGALDADDHSRNPEVMQEKHAFLSSPGYIFGSLNEGFADLFAHYSMDEAAGLFDIACFAQTRDVLSATMYSGLPKVWDDSLWQETFDRSARLGADAVDKAEKSPLELCSLPSFDDIHVVGAVIAHTVDAVFQTAVIARPEGLSPTLFKAGLLMQWIQELRRSDEVLELSNKQTLSRVLNVALGTGLRALGDADKKAFCGVVRSKFPVLLDRWAEKPAEDAYAIVSVCRPG